MALHIKISSTLRAHIPAYDPLQGLDRDFTQCTAAQLAEKLGLPLREIKFVMINGRQMPMDTELHDGDRVAYFPPVGGG